MEKKVSVIVPVYRTLEWLARCVQSITGQTYKNLEIILVDDGSPDDCRHYVTTGRRGTTEFAFCIRKTAVWCPRGWLAYR